MVQKLFKLNIASKISLLIIFTGFFVVFLGLLAGAFFGTRLVHDATGNAYLEKAQVMSNLISSLIDEKVRQLELPSHRRLWVVWTAESNQQLARMSAAQRLQYFQQKDKEWLANSGNNPLVADILTRPLSSDIKTFIEIDKSIIEMFIADRYGGVVGASGKITDYYQADEEWWQAAFAGGKGADYISKIEYDPSSDVWGVAIAVPIKDKNGSVVGIIKTVLDSKTLFHQLAAYNFGKTGQVLLFDVNSDTIYDFSHGLMATKANDKINVKELKTLLSNNKHFAVINKLGAPKENLVVAINQINNPLLEKYDIKLLMVVIQDASEVFGPLNWMAHIFYMIGLLCIILLVPLGWFLGHRIADPIKDFCKVTKEIVKGNWDYKFQVRTGDEIEDFADSFKVMVDNLKDQRLKLEDFANGLEEKVKERTKELTETEEATLNILEDLTEAKIRLEDALKVKTDFTSMVSHEMRTPLTAIKEGIGIVADGTAGAITPQQQEFLNIAKHNVDRLHRLINDVLDFSKLEAKKVEFHLTSNDLREIVGEAVNSQKTTAERKGLALKLEKVGDLPKILCDMDRITQVMVNLLTNAIKFTEHGGIIVTIGLDESGKNAKVCVADTGAGIAAEDFPKLFQKFGQLGGIGGRKTGGTGLGLAICKEIIEQHKGRIWVESEIGRGSKFCFTLPI
jgi:signal transduction histidine kinase